MELVTVSEFFLTASLALLISFIVAKLVSLATTDTHITTKKHHVQHQPVLQVQQQLTVQTESRTGFINPVQVTATTTNLVTDHNIIDATVESVSNGVNELPLTKLVIDGDVTEVKTDVKNDDEIVEEISEENFNEENENFNEEKEKDDDENNDDDDDDDWEWEGIERSEVEKTFMAATEFVAEKGYIGNLDDEDVEMEFYGFHKVAMEGPCRESQPMALKLSARAKWNAWQKLGNMSPEVAMERYISLLSDKVPGWMKDHISAGMTEGETAGSEVFESAAPDLSSALSNQQTILTEREHVQESSIPELIPLAESDLENNVKK